MTHLAVIRGLTYTRFSQVFNRWMIPTYRTAFRWTGNRFDAEDATAWTFLDVAAGLSLPDLVQAVDDQMVDVTVRAVMQHWEVRYGIDRVGYGAINPSETAHSLETLFDGLTAEMRLLLVLRFLRRRSPAAIAAQVRIPPEAARRRIVAALALVAQHIGLPAASVEPPQFDQLSTYLDDIIARRRPLRFAARPESWPLMVGAAHLQAAIAGNDLPARSFVRSLERRLQAGRGKRLVTDARIWSA